MLSLTICFISLLSPYQQNPVCLHDVRTQRAHTIQIYELDSSHHHQPPTTLPRVCVRVCVSVCLQNISIYLLVIKPGPIHFVTFCLFAFAFGRHTLLLLPHRIDWCGDTPPNVFRHASRASMMACVICVYVYG